MNNLFPKRFTGPAVVKSRLTGLLQAGFIQKCFNFIFLCAVKNRCRHVNAVTVFICKLHQFIGFQVLERVLGLRIVEYSFQFIPQQLYFVFLQKLV